MFLKTMYFFYYCIYYVHIYVYISKRFSLKIEKSLTQNYMPSFYQMNNPVCNI